VNSGRHPLDATDFDLTDFGLAPGTRNDTIAFQWGYGQTVQVRNGFALVGAMNSAPVPEPAWLLLFIAELAG